MSRQVLFKTMTRGTYRVPAIIAVISGAGLIFALVGDGLWDVMSWLAVGLPLAIAAWVWWPMSAFAQKATPTGRVLDQRAQNVVDRLHTANRRQVPSLIAYFVRRSVPYWLKGSTLPVDASHEAYLSDKLVSLNPTKCELCYALCAAAKARNVVEIGTSFGVSTIYLAAAVRDGGETGRVIGTEIDPAKAARARVNFAAAGLESYVELREGDALETLKDLSEPIDFVLIDTWIPVAHPMLEQLKPLLRPGAIVVCDNTKRFRSAYSDYLNFINDRTNGFRSVLLPYAGGLEISIKTSD